jgi:cellulose biosynthesis protein BcsQ
MTTRPVLFADVLPAAIVALDRAGVARGDAVLVRDLSGRIRAALDLERKDADASRMQRLDEDLGLLGAYSETRGARILFRGDLLDPDIVFRNPGIQEVAPPEYSGEPVRLLDRQLVGEDWLRTGVSSDIPRLVFYGFKGGVGRSTAVAVAAYHLASKGKRVLLLDLDLESPGLSALVLPQDSRADFGLVDWLVEDAVEQGDLILPRLVASSPMGQETPGAIRVVSAVGGNTDPTTYLAKLARAYADVGRPGRVDRFAERLARLVTALEAEEKPDVVLIDSRAGLHDLAAISVVGLSTMAYLFATGSPQSWQGYRLLFSHWRSYPRALVAIRDRLTMVHALFPETDQVARAQRFREDSCNLFADTVYETAAPGAGPGDDVFNFDPNDESAPHWPVRVLWNSRFQEFDPMTRDRGILTEALTNATFGELLERITDEVESSRHE